MVAPVTEAGWTVLLEALRGLEHRLCRLAGDAQVLSDEMLDSNYGPTVAKWGNEAGRIGRELAQALEVIERVRPDAAADTDVIALADVAEPTPLATQLREIAQRVHDLACQPGLAAELRAIADGLDA